MSENIDTGHGTGRDETNKPNNETKLDASADSEPAAVEGGIKIGSKAGSNTDIDELNNNKDLETILTELDNIKFNLFESFPIYQNIKPKNITINTKMENIWNKMLEPEESKKERNKT